MIDYSKLVAARLNLDIDYSRMAAELISAMNSHRAIKIEYPLHETTEITTVHSLFLRKDSIPSLASFETQKKESDNKQWRWADDICVPYTQSVIDSLPYTFLKAVCVGYFPNAGLGPHVDWTDHSDFGNTLGLSIIPSTGDTCCEIWSDSKNQFVSIDGNAMLFNDSITHRVPKSSGLRITVRVFGIIDYSWFDNKIDYDKCYFK